ncbi:MULTISPECIES: peptidoglycan-binding protein [unclassified Spirillospora]|uniref:peptidoglycan-binding domain-containing protein n=1 Tax=unclassified Spirillospora TaxID=2642701 RepID=UPI00370F93BF
MTEHETQTAKAPPWPGRNITQPPPMKGDDVRTWQMQMRKRGWTSIVVDSIYGPHSEKVCRAFQKEKKLQIDGIVGPKTWKATWTAPITKPGG